MAANEFINLLSTIPEFLQQRLISLSEKSLISPGIIEFVVLYGDNRNLVEESAKNLNIQFIDLGFGFGIISLNISEISKLSQIQGIDYLELPKIVYTTDISSNTSSCVPEAWNIYNLTGKGVLVGFIDSGIDYTHPAFMDERGNTRIEYIYDLSTGGTVYNKAQIQEAINSPSPLTIVPSTDVSGHGTHVAGIACGGGQISRPFYGPAFESSIAMVRIMAGGSVNTSRDTLIMRGIRFLLEKSDELKQPLVINISLSTNDGAHNGTSLFEQYINVINTVENVTIVISAGNEGNAAHHVGGVLNGTLTIPFNVSPAERGLIIQIYKGLLSNIDIQIRNPSGISSGSIPIEQGYFSGSLGLNRYSVFYSGPTPLDINGEIIVSLINARTDFVQQGQWNLVITLTNDEESNFDMWLPISEGINVNTRFLNPTVENTLGIPATVSSVISVGSYNNLTNTISPFSGRGSSDFCIKKPDLIAPGENILSAAPGGGIDSRSGTSMAAPEVTGICALLLQWGIVNGNNIFLYGDTLKYYLLRGAIRDLPTRRYPNNTWGFGKVCLSNALRLLLGTRSMNEPTLNPPNCPNIIDDFNDPTINVFVIRYKGDFDSIFTNIDYACGIRINEIYGLASLAINDLPRFTRDTSNNVDIITPVPYTLEQISPVDAGNITPIQKNPYLNLTGRGVVVALIDTGIDYLNEEFIYEDGRSKVIEIWDQTIPNTSVSSQVPFGSIYTNAQINEAISLKRANGDPYSIVPSRDTVGHGTEMAGIIGARGYNNEITTVAPDCDFLVVKLIPAKSELLFSDANVRGGVYDDAALVAALSYVERKFLELGKPLVVYLPLGTSLGAHNGTNIIERYIDQLCYKNGLAVCTGTGNEGLSETHYLGTLSFEGEKKEALLEIPPNQSQLIVEVWGNFGDELIVSVTSPSGQTIVAYTLEPRIAQQYKFIFEDTDMTLIYYLPDTLSGNQLTFLLFQNLKPGIWSITVQGNVVIDGNFNIWLPQKSLLVNGTRFLNPAPETTLTVPSTTESSIVTSYYNQNDNSIVAESGKGFTVTNKIVPQITTGGINVKTIGLNNRVVTVSGSSTATAVISGVAALFLQWGIVNGNQRSMYCAMIRTYLIQGARQTRGIVYPNIEWGYGQLDLLESFNSLAGKSRSTTYRYMDDKYVEFKDDGMLYRIPRNLYDYIKQV